mmetsp:Transcript_111169/g.192761  ORF Transcript_111169/g.192761 Transcript_111169/m.192761 type:complete len:344 (+) Transcript_111169:103-1134(+)
MVSFAQEGKLAVNFGFEAERFGGDEDVGETTSAKPRNSFAPLAQRSQLPHSARNAGLGKNLGGQLTRSALGGAAYQMLEPGERARQLRHEHSANTLRQRKVTRLSAEPVADLSEGTARPWITSPLTDNEPQGMFRELLLSDQGWASEQQSREDLRVICDHRWTFRGAMELAERSRSLCFFVRCLLDLQRNVQLEDEGDALDPKLVKACALFVTGQCNMGRAADMYQLLTHFISNAVIFDEWDRYLKGAFESSRANQESFLIPYLEQVWGRFCRLIDVLEEIFSVLNSRFVWLHRLPRVGELVREHMKRRCFSGDSVTRNDMIMSEKCSNETVKSIKRAFAFNT